jgi:hypothetical protein
MTIGLAMEDTDTIFGESFDGKKNFFNIDNP